MTIEHCTNVERKGIERSADRVRQVFPDRIRSIVLFGSKGTGVATAESDVDILVIVDRKDRGITEGIFDIAHEIFLETDCL